jgi:hypothetical protein
MRFSSVLATASARRANGGRGNDMTDMLWYDQWLNFDLVQTFRG